MDKIKCSLYEGSSHSNYMDHPFIFYDTLTTLSTWLSTTYWPVYIILHHHIQKNASYRTVAHYNFIIMVVFNIKEEFISWKLVPSISSLQVFWSINLHKTLNCTTMQTSFTIKTSHIATVAHWVKTSTKSTKSKSLTFVHHFQQKIVFPWRDYDIF